MRVRVFEGGGHRLSTTDLNANDLPGLAFSADLKRAATYFAILDVGLAADGGIQHNRDLFAAMWTFEKVFHGFALVY